jgi:colanic acid/amylovoran biosynthesis protein
MKIVITHTLLLNGGDAGITQCTIDLLRRTYGPDADIVLHDSCAAASAPLYPELAVSSTINAAARGSARGFVRVLLRYAYVFFVAMLIKCRCPGAWSLLREAERSAMRDYIEADLVVSAGGTYLVENYFLLPQALDYRVAMLFRKPLVFFTQSLGPFRSVRNRWLLRPVFHYASAILVRDQQSKDHLLQLSPRLASKISVVPDAVFLWVDELSMKKGDLIKWKTSELSICISVRDWQYFRSKTNTDGMDDYVNQMALLVNHCVRSLGSTVTFLSTCQGSRVYMDDSAVAKRIVDLVDVDVRQSVTVDTDFHCVQALRKRVRDFDCVIATRMHMCIIAAGQGVPILPIAYEFKTYEFARSLRIGDWVVDIEEIGSVSLPERIDRWIAEIPARMPSVRAALLSMRSKVISGADEVFVAIPNQRTL